MTKMNKDNNEKFTFCGDFCLYSSISGSSRCSDCCSILSLSCGSTGECEDMLDDKYFFDKDHDTMNQSYEAMAIVSSNSTSNKAENGHVLESREELCGSISSQSEFMTLPKTIAFLSGISSDRKEYLHEAPVKGNCGSTKSVSCEHFGASLSDLPDELVYSIASYLDIPSLNHFRSICKHFLVLASRDEAGWENHCRRIWHKKSHVCSAAITLFQNKKAMKAYQTSCRDGKHRHEIAEDELCFDPLTGNGTRWSFRFKQSAGSDWTSLDPWWSGGETRKMVFLRDGTVKQLVDNCPQQSPGHPNMRFMLRDAFFDARGGEISVPVEDLDSLAGVAPSRQIMTWRMVSQPMDLPMKPQGAYIRLNLGGRDVPTYIVHRSPTGNWGFIMESCWGIFSSFELPRRRQEHELRDSNHRDNPRMRLRRTQEGGQWFNVHGLESDSEEEQERNQVAADSSMLDDSAFSVTNCWQWREALLYNYGAMVLPEGEGATEEFDRLWSEAIRPRQVNTSPIPEETMQNYMGNVARAPTDS